MIRKDNLKPGGGGGGSCHVGTFRLEDRVRKRDHGSI